jgi:hypothetical protein
MPSRLRYQCAQARRPDGRYDVSKQQPRWPPPWKHARERSSVQLLRLLFDSSSYIYIYVCIHHLTQTKTETCYRTGRSSRRRGRTMRTKNATVWLQTKISWKGLEAKVDRLTDLVTPWTWHVPPKSWCPPTSLHDMAHHKTCAWRKQRNSPVGKGISRETTHVDQQIIKYSILRLNT